MRLLEFLGADGVHYAVGHVVEATRVPSGWQRLAGDDAARLLPSTREQLEQLWHELRSGTAYGDASPDALERWAADELARPTGRLALWRVRAPAHASSVPQLGDVPSLSDLLPSQPAEVRTWVAFRLLDLHGDPLPDVRYELTLSDGTLLDGTTDGDGAVRHDDVVAGGCTIEFPELPETFWEHAHNA